MEISFEEPYEDLPEFQNPPKQNHILISLNNLNINSRFHQIQKPEKIVESPSSPDLDYENQISLSPNAKIYKFPISTYSSTYSKPDPLFIHKQLKKPNFDYISKIYSNYSKTEDPKVYQIKPTPLPKSHQRPISAPLYRKAQVHEVMKQRESDFKKNCTFKPKINNVRRGELSQQQKTQQLARPKSEQYEKRERQKRQQEEVVFNECTFRPKINNRQGLNLSFAGFTASERLYQDAELKLNEKEKVKRAREEEELTNYPFHPQVNSPFYKLNGNKLEKPPIYERFREVQNERELNRKHIRNLSENNDEHLTFQPKINRNSYVYASMKKRRASPPVMQSSIVRNESEYKSFEDRGSVSPSQTSYSFKSNHTEFLERQKVHQEKSRARREEFLNKISDKTRNFTPEIGTTSKYLAEANKYRKPEKVEERLMSEGVKNKIMKQEMKEKFYSNFTHEPEINKISQSIAKPTSLLEIANNKFTLAMKQKLAEEKALEEEKKNSFTPKINKNFEYVSSCYRQSDEMFSTIRTQFLKIQQKREENKRAKETEEMRECTFTPQGKIGSISGLDNKVEIKGIDRFMELRSIAKRKEDEMKEREKKLFFQNVKNRTENSFTVPQPFNIHPSNKTAKVARVIEEIRQKEQAECVFRPRLIE